MIEIKKNAIDDYCFILKAESGQALLNSVTFSNKITVDEVVDSLTTLKRNRNTIERKTNHSGKFLFCLKNNNGEIIGNSLLYGSEAGMENGIKNLISRINFLSESNQL
ncbi:MAG: YegP family protein [Maribacter sp.]|uniref:YegP family protein n=1 Tax=Maribacter sp. TaxID=1897614 RepID=UPI003296895D